MTSHPLTNLLEAFPDFLSTYLLPPWPYLGDGIKLLRAVSKGLGSIAEPAVQSCRVEIGDRLHVPPGRVASLVKDVKLKRLTVLVTICEGPEAPGVPDQLSTCVAHMGDFLNGAQSAVQHTTRLDLRVERTRNAKRDQGASMHVPEPSTFAPSTHPNLYSVPRTVFTVLAAAVPNVEHMDVRALYGEVDFSAFGKLCPKMTTLTLEADSMALQGIDLALPGLTHLTLSDNDGFYRHHSCTQVQSYVDTASLLLHGCTNLTSLNLRFHYLPWTQEVQCPKQTWEQLPPSLVEWECRAEFPHMLEATSFMQRLQVLSVGKLPCETLIDLLTLAPCLKSLDVWPFNSRVDTVELMWRSDISPTELSRLKAHLLGGFKLGCESVVLSGTSTMVRDMLAWICPLESTGRVCVDLHSTVHVPDCLSQLLRVAPKLQYLVLGDLSDQPGAPWLEESFLTPLTGCPDLWRIDVHLRVIFTHAGLVRLCMSLPALSELFCKPCEGVSYGSVMAELALKGREVVITVVLQGQELPVAYEDE